MTRPSPRTRLPWLLLLSAGVVLVDRLSKLWVVKHVPFGEPLVIIPRVFRITHVLNDGAAFSLFADAAKPNAVRWGLVAFSLLAALAVSIALFRIGSRFTATTVALALVLGGALGNVYDRIRYAFVVDFLEVHIVHYHWPDFNVADSAIVTGACLLMLDALWPQKTTASVTEVGAAETGEDTPSA